MPRRVAVYEGHRSPVRMLILGWVLFAAAFAVGVVFGWLIWA
jgi:hypothetical protein